TSVGPVGPPPGRWLVRPRAPSVSWPCHRGPGASRGDAPASPPPEPVPALVPGFMDDPVPLAAERGRSELRGAGQRWAWHLGVTGMRPERQIDPKAPGRLIWRPQGGLIRWPQAL